MLVVTNYIDIIYKGSGRISTSPETTHIQSITEASPVNENSLSTEEYTDYS